MLPVFELGEEFARENVPGTLVAMRPHDAVKGATVYRYRFKNGEILVTVASNRVQEVLYQMPCRMPWSKRKKNKFLFNHYSPVSDWDEVQDNGQGKIYRTLDGSRYAIWAYKYDHNTFGTMDFHEEKL
ncbi:hypothetical protein TDB9533_01580 [Thalassocella blandensis]|nr:hypothetical protein TDB9533_01580 [Thalassocella blandensis]